MPSYGRPKKVDEESVLQLISEAKKITQRDLQQQTGLKKNTLSGYIKKWREAGRIQTEKVRQGSITLTFISLVETPANWSIESQSTEGSSSQSESGAGATSEEPTESAEGVKPEEPSESGAGAEPEEPTESGEVAKPEKPVKASPKSVSMGLNFALAFNLRNLLCQAGMDELFFLEIVGLLAQKSEKEVIQTLLDRGHPFQLIQRSLVNAGSFHLYLGDRGGQPEIIYQLLSVFQALPPDLLTSLEKEVRKRWGSKY